jgi:cytochrome b
MRVPLEVADCADISKESGMSHAPRVARTKLVWDPLVRVFHWTLVLGFFFAYFSEGEPMKLHVWAGYVVGAVVLLRIVWGFVGTPHARFSDFVFPAGRVISYLIDELRMRAPRRLGHSPAGGAMVIALLVMLLATTGSGLTLLAVHEGQGPFSAFIGQAESPNPPSAGSASDETGDIAESPTVELWEEVHEVLANLTLLLVILHVGGVVLASYEHKENLVAAMFDGRKRP